MSDRFEVGDRFPDVAIQRGETTQALYNAAKGQCWLLGWSSDADTLTMQRSAARSLGAGFLCLRRAEVEGEALEGDVRAPAPLYQRVTGANPEAAGVLLLEPSMRVLLRVEGVAASADPLALDALLRRALDECGVIPVRVESDSHASAAGQASAAGKDEGVRTLAESGGSPAPVLIVPRVLEPDLVARVLTWFRGAGEGRDSGVLVHDKGEQNFQLDPTVKMRREAHLDDAELEAAVHERIMRRALPEMARAFAFEVRQREAFKVLRYAASDAGGYFRAHRDNDARDVAHRRFAMTLNLNSGKYAGGRLRFPEFGPQEYEAPTGGALIFSCSLLHEVTDLTAGTRYAMTTFFF